MTEHDFWAVIALSRLGGKGHWNLDDGRLATELWKLSPDELVQFDRWFGEFIRAAFSWDLWGAAYLIGSGCGNDMFWDFRSWLVAQGERVYKTAVKDPESLLETINWFGFPLDAYRGEEGTRLEDFHRSLPAYSCPTIEIWGKMLGKEGDDAWEQFPLQYGSNLGEEPSGERFEDTEDHLKSRYPKLWSKFGW